MRNNWDVDDDSEMFHVNQKKKRKFRLEEENYLKKRDDYEEDESFREEDYEEEK